jgi:hypothetical protein
MTPQNVLLEDALKLRESGHVRFVAASARKQARVRSAMNSRALPFNSAGGSDASALAGLCCDSGFDDANQAMKIMHDDFDAYVRRLIHAQSPPKA